MNGLFLCVLFQNILFYPRITLRSFKLMVGANFVKLTAKIFSERVILFSFVLIRLRLTHSSVSFLSLCLLVAVLPLSACR